jgi:glyoxylase-like metal-dependent hydrolase (beta-lactamase superfamily II)
MQIIRISPRGFGANAYVLTQDNQTAIVIDPAQPRIAEEVKKLGLEVKYVLLTHCHFDHVGGVPALQKAGAKVVCSRKEKEDIVGKYGDLFDLFGAPRVAYTVNTTFEDGEELDLCGLRVKTLVTPGHTSGSACYLISDGDEQALFTGDTLFAGTIGRTDFPTGDMATIIQSLKRLMTLDESLPIYAGHEEDTSIGQEKRTNPFLD